MMEPHVAAKANGCHYADLKGSVGSAPCEGRTLGLSRHFFSPTLVCLIEAYGTEAFVYGIL